MVLNPDEVRRPLAVVSRGHAVFERMLDGTGMYLMEGLRMRVNDPGTAHRTLVIWQGKDRAVMLPLALMSDRRLPLDYARTLWRQDQAEGTSGVFGQCAGAHVPAGAGFLHMVMGVPGEQMSVDPRNSKVRRHHMFDQEFQRAFKKELKSAGVDRLATPHT